MTDRQPDYLINAQPVPPSSVLVTFADGCSGTVDLRALGLDPRSLRRQSVRAASHGAAIEIEDDNGHTVHIDASVLRAEIDPQFKKMLADEVETLQPAHDVDELYKEIDKLKAERDAAEDIVHAVSVLLVGAGSKESIIRRIQDLREAARGRAELQAKVDRLEVAIRKHRDQKADDRCHLDDDELYAVLDDGGVVDRTMPPRDKHLENCARFYDRRCEAGNWPSYQELEFDRECLRKALIGAWVNYGVIPYDSGSAEASRLPFASIPPEPADAFLYKLDEQAVNDLLAWKKEQGHAD